MATAVPRLSAALPGTGGTLRASPEDFEVEELPAYLPSGAGEHLFLWVEKVELDTPAAARLLARALGVEPGTVGWAGLKDRRAVTRQWLSVPASAEPALATAELPPGVRVLRHARHGNKLRVGHLRANRFRIRIAAPTEPEAARAVLALLATRGMANAYGPQRFGRGDGSLRGKALVLGERLPRRPTPFERKLFISAYQAALFNRLLAARMDSGRFGRVEVGDLLRKADSGGLFVCRAKEEDQPRTDRLEVSPTGPVFGWKMPRPEGTVDAEEQALLAAEGLSLERFRALGGLAEGARRPFAVQVEEASAELDRQDLVLQFTLPAGSYATVLLDEVMKSTAAETPVDEPGSLPL
jgi:tRNA pseudouridine13 synthase